MVNEKEVKKDLDKCNLELNVLHTHIKYAFLESNVFFMIISTYLTCDQEQRLIEWMKK